VTRKSLVEAHAPRAINFYFSCACSSFSRLRALRQNNAVLTAVLTKLSLLERSDIAWKMPEVSEFCDPTTFGGGGDTCEILKKYCVRVAVFKRVLPAAYHDLAHVCEAGQRGARVTFLLRCL